MQLLQKEYEYPVASRIYGEPFGKQEAALHKPVAVPATEGV